VSGWEAGVQGVNAARAVRRRGVGQASRERMLNSVFRLREGRRPGRERRFMGSGGAGVKGVNADLGLGGAGVE
jgi:hypothetical protein